MRNDFEDSLCPSTLVRRPIERRNLTPKVCSVRLCPTRTKRDGEGGEGGPLRSLNGVRAHYNRLSHLVWAIIINKLVLLLDRLRPGMEWWQLPPPTQALESGTSRKKLDITCFGHPGDSFGVDSYECTTWFRHCPIQRDEVRGPGQRPAQNAPVVGLFMKHNQCNNRFSCGRKRCSQRGWPTSEGVAPLWSPRKGGRTPGEGDRRGGDPEGRSAARKSFPGTTKLIHLRTGGTTLVMRGCTPTNATSRIWGGQIKRVGKGERQTAFKLTNCLIDSRRKMENPFHHQKRQLLRDWECCSGTHNLREHQ